MKCTQCSEEVTTVGDVRACKRCTQAHDGTAALIPVSLNDPQSIRDAIDCVPGLANRFIGPDAPITATQAIKTDAMLEDMTQTHGTAHTTSKAKAARREGGRSKKK